MLVLKMVIQIDVREVFSHLTGGLGHFTDSSNFPSNQSTTFSSTPGCNNTAEVPSLIVRTRSRSNTILSRIDGVWMYNDSMIILHRLCQIPRNCLFQ